MNIQEYKTKIKEFSDRLSRLEKEHSRQTVIYEEAMKNLEKYGIKSIEEVDTKIAELQEEITVAQKKLSSYLASFDEKLTEVEKLL